MKTLLFCKFDKNSHNFSNYTSICSGCCSTQLVVIILVFWVVRIELFHLCKYVVSFLRLWIFINFDFLFLFLTRGTFFFIVQVKSFDETLKIDDTDTCIKAKFLLQQVAIFIFCVLYNVRVSSVLVKQEIVL